MWPQGDELFSSDGHTPRRLCAGQIGCKELTKKMRIQGWVSMEVVDLQGIGKGVNIIKIQWILLPKN